MGADARWFGLPAVPPLSELCDVDVPVGTMDRTNIKAWLRGWHAANLDGDDGQ